jgi:ADP-heptose:LPS heptosyltransferase
VEPGEIWLTDKEKERYKGYKNFIYVEPNVKGSFSGNKDWGFEKWQKVINQCPELRFLQGKGKKLNGCEQVGTQSFRDACALLYHADLFIGTDGGLHHAAAALGKQAVVVWGGLVSPKILGYETHTNLHSGVPSCGNHAACEHCRRALDAIKPEMVVNAIRSYAVPRTTGAVQESNTVR